MYSVGQKVLYGSNGVCVIEDITEKKVGREKIEYYVLKPVCAKSSTLYVPTHNEKLVSRIRFVLSADQIRDILKNFKSELSWDDNKLNRNDSFRAVISGARCDELISLVRLIYSKRAELEQRGKRLHVSDERFLREAEKMLCDEISDAFQIDGALALQMVLENATA